MPDKYETFATPAEGWARSHAMAVQHGLGKKGDTVQHLLRVRTHPDTGTVIMEVPEKLQHLTPLAKSLDKMPQDIQELKARTPTL